MGLALKGLILSLTSLGLLLEEKGFLYSPCVSSGMPNESHT